VNKFYKYSQGDAEANRSRLFGSYAIMWPNKLRQFLLGLAAQFQKFEGLVLELCKFRPVLLEMTQVGRDQLRFSRDKFVMSCVPFSLRNGMIRRYLGGTKRD